MKRIAFVCSCFFALLFVYTYSIASGISGKYVGKGEGSKNELTVQDLGSGTIKFNIFVEGTFKDGLGGICVGSIPTDESDITAKLIGNIATYKDGDGCILRITFKGKKVVVREDGCFMYHGAKCDFNATYRKKKGILH